MPILDFFPKEKPVNSLIQKENDPIKYDAVASKLCDKRIIIEEQLTTRANTEREAFTIRLIEIKDAMKTFGVTEIDYQAYVAQLESKNGATHSVSDIQKQAHTTSLATNNQTEVNTEDTFHD